MDSVRRITFALTILLALICGTMLADGIASRAGAQPSAGATQASPGGVIQPAPQTGMYGMQEMQGTGPMGERMMCHHHRGSRVLRAVGALVGLSVAFAFVSLGVFLLRRSNPPRAS